MRETIGRELRLAVRALLRAPGATTVIAACLALGIGASTTVFSWTESLVLRPLPAVPAMDRLVTVRTGGTQREGAVSWPDYRDWRDQTRTLTGLAAWSIGRFRVQSGRDATRAGAEPVWGLYASANYFDVLRVRPAVGRTFRADEVDAPGGAPVVVISDGFWATHFRRDRGAIGRTLRVGGRELTVIGVAPRDFAGTIAALRFDLWVPITMRPSLAPSDTGALEGRATRWLELVGRLAPGATRERARAELDAIGRRVAEVHTEDRDVTARVLPFDTGTAQLLRPLFTTLVGLSGMVLLLVCFNVGNLLLARGVSRRRELAIRAALGGGRARIARQLLAESAALAVLGAGLGLALAVAARGLLPALVPPSPLPVAIAAPFDARVVAYAAALTAGVLLLFGLAPALRGSRVDLGDVLKSRTSEARGGARLRSALVAAQLALSLATLTAAGLFLRQARALSAMDRGIADGAHVLLVHTDLALADYDTPEQRRQAAERLVDHARRAPGVRDAAVATFVPLGFSGYDRRAVAVPGYAPRPGESTEFLVNVVGPGYFTVAGVAIRRGRGVTREDRAESAPVAVVNEAFAARFWPDGNPLDRRIDVGGRALRVVGVAADGKYDLTAMRGATPPFVYLAFAQWPASELVLHVRTAGDPLAALPGVRRAMAAVDPALPALQPTTLEAYTSLPLVPVRLGATVLGALGGASLLLASLGLYGVASHSTRRRTREIGVRMALGATRGGVARVVVGESLRTAAVGVGAGVPLALAVARVMHARLTRLPPGDAPALLGAVLLLGVVTLAASWLPARRAARVDPAASLRAE